MNKNFKNIIAILDNDFGNLRLIKDDNNGIHINDVDLTNAAKNLLLSMIKYNYKLFLLIREKENLETQIYEQIDTLLSYDFEKHNFIKTIAFNDDLEELFTKIETRFSLKPEDTIFISSDRSSRHISIKKGYYALPHPKAANMIIEGKSIKFARIILNQSYIDIEDKKTETPEITNRISIKDILPYYFEEIDNNNNTELLAIVSNDAINKAIELKLDIQILDVDLSSEDVVLVNLDSTFTKELIEETTSNYGFLILDDNKIIITVREKKIANIPLHGRHGHFIQLIPDDTLLFKFKSLSQLDKRFSGYILKKTMNVVKNWPNESVKFKTIRNIFSTLSEIKLDAVNPNSILNDIKRYSGEIDLDSQGKIISRHCLHPDNRRSVLALESDLKQMGYFVRVWEFQADSRPPGRNPEPGVDGATFYNVIAELPGIGANLFLEQDLSSKIRDILLKYPNPLHNTAWIYEVKTLLGNEWLDKNNLQNLDVLDLKRKLEEIFGLEQWSNWWIKDKEKPGLGSEIIIVGCHLDSTANLRFDASGNSVKNDEYNPQKSKAPGADDDGSGLAATLELARVFSKLQNKLTHTIQFCFFNAEEVGLRGSLEYAKYMRRINAPVAAVLCIDMIGYNKDKKERTFEIHAGHNNVKIRDECLPLAKFVEESANQLGQLTNKAQIYKGLTSGTNKPDEGNRDKYDGAIQRSDHWSFQTHGYPAVLVSEDFFINIPTVESIKDSNPHYHKITDNDTEIDSSYAGDIASSVALTVKKIAGDII